MKIEQLCVDNLREGVYCPHGLIRSDEVYDQLEAWLDGNLLRGQIARDDDNNPIGFILYYAMEGVPMEVDGSGLYMVQCLFVKPEFQGLGVGRALVESAMADAMECGALGLAAQAHSRDPGDRPDFLPGAFYQHMGMCPTESRGSATLYYKAYNPSAPPPRYLDPKFSPPRDNARVRIDILDCRRCYTAVTNRNIVKEVADGLGEENVVLVVHDQNTRGAILDKGMSAGIFIDGKLTFFDGPISEDDVWNAIEVARSARGIGTDREQ